MYLKDRKKMPKKFVIIECQKNYSCGYIFMLFLTWDSCITASVYSNYTAPIEIMMRSPEIHAEQADTDILQGSLIISEVNVNNESLHAHLPFAVTKFPDLNYTKENDTISSSVDYAEVEFTEKDSYNIVSPTSNLSYSIILDKSEIPRPHDVLSWYMTAENTSDASESSQIHILKVSLKSDLVPNDESYVHDSVTSSSINNVPPEKTIQTTRYMTTVIEAVNATLNTLWMNKDFMNPYELTNNSRKLNSSTSFVPHNTSLSFFVNATKQYVVEKSRDMLILKIIIAVIGSLCILFIGLLAAYYRWWMAGRRRKVYFSHHSGEPKNFADNTGVRSPVLMPDEIEMQVGRLPSLHVRRAVILATDSVVTETGFSEVESSTIQPSSDAQAVISTTPPPPPYRTPPPYLPDMIIENIHAL